MHASIRKSRHPLKVPTRTSAPPKPFPGRHFGWALLRTTVHRGR